ncbi:3-oxoacyl-[acyl-carrier-protein] synthase 2 [Limihaloglobus sulfuriphilus]|uniref:3-oxoacyl-[acyl-carrier-protein] synthase 2 n=1 Tax=Limihaloglobus sulfuriphilus TaxID=1851148 RepID=A0A1Q2MDT9_9BACT|nr:beta-ketoacyl-[acyl-carrier-protein] synthase family protein [Limihaloglobus sulfuriphilus]AQQ70873.1 3-oxoacyl-[acyl-carrier-protein] synthase 2 [Limihaloglobus sulfuriphilus]
MKTRNVLITGLGAISPLGLSAEELWKGICEGVCGLKEITAFDASGFECRIAGEAPEFKVNKFVPKYHRKATKLMSRDIQLAVVAADDAVRSSGLITKAIDPDNVSIDPERFAINIGSGMISCDLPELAPAVAASLVDGKFNIKAWGEEGISKITPLWLLKYLPNMLACHVGIIHDIRGPGNNITLAEVSGLVSVIEAAQTIDRGDSDAALAGAAEAKINPVVLMRQQLLKRSFTGSCDPPETACRPFDKNARGSVFSEGGGIAVLEDSDTAASRNAKVYAQIAGCGQSMSLNKKFECLEPGGKGLEIAVTAALKDAGITAAEIDLVLPHGTGVAGDDAAEAAALSRVFGTEAQRVYFLPTKSMIGHCGAASGIIDIILACKAMENSYIPAAKNCEENISGLKISDKPIEKKINYALCCGYTFGGQTAAVVLKNPEVK